MKYRKEAGILKDLEYKQRGCVIKKIFGGDFMRKNRFLTLQLAILMTITAHSPVWGASLGAVSGDYVFVEDSTVTLLSGAYDTSAVSVDSGQNVSGSDIVLTLVNNSGNQYVNGIEAKNGGTVQLEAVKVIAEGPFNSGLYAYNGGSITIGDSADISGDVQIAVNAYGNNSSVTIGNDAKLQGHIWGGSSAVIYAGAGGSIKIGNGADIQNTAVSGGYQYYHRGLQATGGGSISLGDDCSVVTKGISGTSSDTNHGIVAGELSYGGTAGTVVINDRLKVDVEGIHSYALASYGAGSVLKAGDGAEIISRGNNGYTLMAAEGAELEIGKNSTIKSLGSVSAHIVNAQSNSVVRIGDDSVLSSVGDSTLGISSHGGAKVYLGDGVSLSSSGTIAYGMQSDGTGTEIVAGDGFSFNSTGDRARGAQTRRGGSISFGGDASFITAGVNSHGLYAGATTDGEAGSSIKVGKDLYIKTTGDSSDGIFAGVNCIVNVDAGARIVLEGDGSTGLKAYKGEIIMGGDTVIMTSGEQSEGIYGHTDAKISVGADSHIVTEGDFSAGIYGYASGSEITMAENAAVETKGEGSFGVRADADTAINFTGAARIATEGAAAAALVANAAGAKITAADDMTIITSGEGAYGVYAVDGGKIILGDQAFVSTSGAAADGIYVIGSDSTVELQGAVSVKVQGADSRALYAKEGTIMASGGKVNIDGDLSAEQGGKIDLKFTDGSVFTGAALAGDGKILLDMEGTQWNVTGDSTLTSLTLNNDALVHLTHSGAYSTLTVDELHGDNGTFKLDVDIRTLEGDKLVVNNASSGNHVLDIYQKDGYEPALSSTEGSGHVLANVSGAAVFTAKEREGSLFYKYYELGAKASETSGFETDWYLDKLIGIDPDDKTTTSVAAVMGASALNYHTWRNDNDKLLQRLGDLRKSGGAEQGAWFRLKGTKLERDGKFSFSNKYTTYELGYDKIISNADADYTRYIGAAFSYGDGDSDYTSGSGSNKNKAVGIYGTHIGNKGHYWDLVLKYSDLDNDFDVYDTEGKKISGDYSNKGIAFSAEYGRKNILKNGWYIEPQAQLTMGYLDGSSYRMNNKVSVDQSNIKSFLGRIGFNIGKDISAKTNIYLKANLLHEFGGDYHLSMTADNGDYLRRDADFSDTWFEYGIGATVAAGKNNYLYFDVERTAGSDFKKEWQWNLGARWMF